VLIEYGQPVMWRYVDNINANILDLSINLTVILIIFSLCRFLKVRPLIALSFAFVPLVLAWYDQELLG